MQANNISDIPMYYKEEKKQYINVIYLFTIYKSNKTILKFCRKLYDTGSNLVDNLNIYNVEEDNRLSPGLQLLITGSVRPVYNS